MAEDEFHSLKILAAFTVTYESFFTRTPTKIVLKSKYLYINYNHTFIALNKNQVCQWKH